MPRFFLNFAIFTSDDSCIVCHRFINYKSGGVREENMFSTKTSPLQRPNIPKFVVLHVHRSHEQKLLILRHTQISGSYCPSAVNPLLQQLKR